MIMSRSPSPYYPTWSFPALGVVALTYTVLNHAWVAVHRRLLGREPLFLKHQLLTIAPTPSTGGKIAIVTGSNTGIGLETAKALVVDHGMTVILACRSRDKAERAAQSINDAIRPHQKGQALFLHPLDLSSFASVRDFATKVKEAYPQGIHVLVNNAGRNTSGKSQDLFQGKEALDLLYQSNFLGHFLLTAELVDLLSKGGAKQTEEARIVNLSSVMHHYCGGCDVESLQFWKDCALAAKPPMDSYSPSKLAALLFSIELNKRLLAKKKIRSIAVNPGAVNSDIWRDFPRFIVAIFRLIYIDNQQGCQTSVAAAVCDLPSKTSQERGDGTPYLQPYPIVWDPQQPAFPPLEMLAPFAGPVITQPRLPADGGLAAAKAMWEASVELTGAKWSVE